MAHASGDVDIYRQLLLREKELEDARRELESLNQQLARRKSERDFDQSSSSKDDTRSWWQKIFCKTRNPPPVESTEASSQDICWQLLMCMEDLNALQCNINDDLTITGATKGACRTWGSAHLTGKPLASLFNTSSSREKSLSDRTAWITRALDKKASPASGHNGVGGFSVKDIGYEAFKNKQNHTFEASVLVATLPPEPRLQKPGKLLVIIDPQVDSVNKGKAHSSGQLKFACDGVSPTNSYNRKDKKKDSSIKDSPYGYACLLEMATVMTDVVIYLDDEHNVSPPDDGKQESHLGSVLSGEKFEDVLDPQSYKEFKVLLENVTYTSMPRAMRARMNQRFCFNGTQEARLIAMDAEEESQTPSRPRPRRKFMIGIRLEGAEILNPNEDASNDELREAIIRQATDKQLQENKRKPRQAMSVAESEVSENSHHLVPSAVTGVTGYSDLRHKHEGFGGGLWRVMPVGLGIGDYSIARTVGMGGQGVVYQVKDQVGGMFALKKVNLPGSLWARDFPSHLRNADREARVLKSLAWASAVIVRVHDCWIQDDFKYACIVMEWLHLSLATHLKDRKGLGVALKDTCRWLTHITTGLAIIHEAGFMHRDIKPQNILLTEDLHWCKIADLGLGRAVREEPLPADRKDNASQVSQATSVMVKSVLSGYTEFQGTKEYISPEADEGGQYNTATDIFSLGCVLYELMSPAFELLSSALASNMRANKALSDLASLSTFSGASSAGESAKAQLEKYRTRIKQDEREVYDDLSQLCTALLEHRAAKRPSAKTILCKKVLSPSIEDLLAHTSEEKLRKFFSALASDQNTEPE